MDQLNIEAEAILHLIQKFREEGRNQSPMFCLWDDFLFRVMLLFRKVIAAIHIGDWGAYQSSRAALLPVLHASNRYAYGHDTCSCIVATRQDS